MALTKNPIRQPYALVGRGSRMTDHFSMRPALNKNQIRHPDALPSRLAYDVVGRILDRPRQFVNSSTARAWPCPRRSASLAARHTKDMGTLQSLRARRVIRKPRPTSAGAAN